MKNFLNGLFLLILTTSASAGVVPVKYSSSQLITESGQSFSWDIFAATSAGDGVFEVEAAGDFNTSGSESTSAFLDNLFEATGLGLANADLVITDTADGHYWEKTFDLSASLMGALTSDNAILVRLVNTAPVNPIWDMGFVSWSLSYDAVPGPATILIFSSALVLLTLVRRRR